jgi:hypothetical protein
MVEAAKGEDQQGVWTDVKGGTAAIRQTYVHLVAPTFGSFAPIRIMINQTGDVPLSPHRFLITDNSPLRFPSHL